MKVVLQTVKNEEKVSRAGENYVRCSIQVRGKWYSGWGDAVTAQWKRGQTVDLDLYEEEYEAADGTMKKSGKFTILDNADDPMEKRIREIEKTLSRCVAFLNTLAEERKAKGIKPNRPAPVLPPTENLSEEKESATLNDLPF